MEPKRPLTPTERAHIEALRKAATEGSYYELLGIPPNERPDRVENAYRDFARQWHPDRFYSRDTGELGQVLDDVFAQATRGYRVLREPAMRAEYDKELVASGRMPTIPEPEPFPDPPAGASPADRHETRFSPRSMPPTSWPPRSVPPASVPPPEAPRPRAPQAVQKIHRALSEQFGRARQYFEAGKADFEAGAFAKAESALYLAAQFDPRNEEFKALYEQARKKATAQRAITYIQQAEAAEFAMRTKEAQQLYQKAVQCDPEEGVAFFRLARMLLAEADERGAVNLLRKAVQKEPRNIEYRLTLAKVYVGQNLHQNAMREVMAVLEVDPKHESARALAKSLRR